MELADISSYSIIATRHALLEDIFVLNLYSRKIQSEEKCLRGELIPEPSAQVWYLHQLLITTSYACRHLRNFTVIKYI